MLGDPTIVVAVSDTLGVAIVGATATVAAAAFAGPVTARLTRKAAADAARATINAAQAQSVATLSAAEAQSRATVDAAEKQRSGTVDVAAHNRFAEWQNRKRETYADFLVLARPAARRGRADDGSNDAFVAQGERVVLVAFSSLRERVRPL